MNFSMARIAVASAMVAFAAPALALEVGDAAPCVVLDQILPSGETTEGCIRERAEGATHTVLEFFSITCGACEVNLPRVAKLSDELGPLATVRMVSIDRNAPAVNDWRLGKGDLIRFPIALDTGRDARRAYDVRVTPTMFILDATDTVVYKHEGVLSEGDRAQIRSLVGAEE